MDFFLLIYKTSKPIKAECQGSSGLSTLHHIVPMNTLPKLLIKEHMPSCSFLSCYNFQSWNTLVLELDLTWQKIALAA